MHTRWSGHHRGDHPPAPDPDPLIARVTEAYRLADLCGASVGPRRGLMAEHLGLLAPFWVAGTVIGLLTIVSRQALGRVERAPDPA